jgi:hypothetical protein
MGVDKKIAYIKRDLDRFGLYDGALPEVHLRTP